MTKWFIRPDMSAEKGEAWAYDGWAVELDVDLTSAQVAAINNALEGYIFINDYDDPEPEPPPPPCDCKPCEHRRLAEGMREWSVMPFRGPAPSYEPCEKDDSDSAFKVLTG